MKVLAFVEFNPENFEKVAEKFRLVTAERQRGSDIFPKIAFPPHVFSGESKIVVIFEDPTEEQLNNLVIHYMPVLAFKFVPLTDYASFMEQYFKVKK